MIRKGEMSRAPRTEAEWVEYYQAQEVTILPGTEDAGLRLEAAPAGRRFPVPGGIWIEGI